MWYIRRMGKASRRKRSAIQPSGGEQAAPQARAVENRRTEPRGQAGDVPSQARQGRPAVPAASGSPRAGRLSTASLPAGPSPLVRLAVTAQEWQAFRRMAGRARMPASVLLGELVRQAVQDGISVRVEARAEREPVRGVRSR